MCNIYRETDRKGLEHSLDACMSEALTRKLKKKNDQQENRVFYDDKFIDATLTRKIS